MTSDAPSGAPVDDAPFALDALRIEPAAGEIAGPVGREQVDPKVMNVLRVLHAHRGRLVPRETLFATVWGERIVTDDVLSRCIYQLRRHLSAAGGPAAADLIETLPKRGYRLRADPRTVDASGLRDATEPIVPVTAAAPLHVAAQDADRSPEAKSSASPFTPRAVAFLGIAALAAVAIYLLAAAPTGSDRGALSPAPVVEPAANAPPANSIAVLPFADLSEARDHAYLAEGLADELLSTLAERSSLIVTARTSSFAFREQGTDLVEVGRRLGVAYVVEGSVRAAGGRLRITTDLVEARSGRRVWSRSHDRDFGDVLALQDEIAESVARSLEATLAARGTRPQAGVAEANDAYLRGRFLWNRRAAGDVEAAARYLRRAVELDPTHALAWAGLAGVYNAEPALDPTLALHREAVVRALAAAPDLAETQVRASQYYFSVGDVDRARRHRARAAEIDPDNVLVLATEAGLAFWEGRYADAVAAQRRVVERDPLSAVQHNNLGGYLMSTGNYAAARKSYQTFVELNPSDAAQVRAVLVQLLVLEGRTEEAWLAAAELPASLERDAVYAMLAPARGEADLAAASLARLSDAADPRQLVRAAEVHAYLGDPDGAWTLLERALEAAAARRGDPAWQVELRGSPFLVGLRSGPRWPEFLKRASTVN